MTCAQREAYHYLREHCGAQLPPEEKVVASNGEAFYVEGGAGAWTIKPDGEIVSHGSDIGFYV